MDGIFNYYIISYFVFISLLFHKIKKKIKSEYQPLFKKEQKQTELIVIDIENLKNDLEISEK